ncbi:MAG TPA: nickel-dependent hydrogenase large subunit, partial [Steroidobacteraceae bacterium]|nr:nickel-dependent hydrogenase large subunit [Steroidobacteraceae bacterium]
MAKVVIDPVTRIEGHLRITCEVENGKVTNAWNTCTLFRGFEIFMKGIKPADAWQFGQRICGVCPTPHALNAAVASERAMGVAKVPDNARLVRNMLNACQIGYDCILWFYTLNAFDYVNVPDIVNAKTDDPQMVAIQQQAKALLSSGQVGILSNFWWDNPGYLLTPEENLLLTSHYIASFPAMQAANQAAAVLSGKFPMIMSLAAGGMTELPSLDEILYYQDQMAIVKDFTDNVLWPDTLAAAGAYKALAGYGAGVGNYLTWGVLEGKSQDPKDRIFPSGGVFGGALKVEPVDPAKPVLYTKYSYYDDGVGAGKTPLKVGQEPIDFTAYPPIEGPDFPTGKYDWTRAARYPNPQGKNVPMEVGPLAEVLVGYLDGRPDFVKYVDEMLAALGATGHPEVLLSSLGRIGARTIKARINMDHYLDWSTELLANIKAGDTDVYTVPPNQTGDGVGISGLDAPRGALSH